MVEQWNRDSGTVQKNSGTVDHLTVEYLKNHGGKLEHLMVEQWNRDGGTVEQRWWNSGTYDGGTVEHVMVERWNI